jgi:hypothetical protein
MNSEWGDWLHRVPGVQVSTSFPYPVFDALRHQPTGFDRVFAFKPLGRVTAIVDGEAEVVFAELVSGDYYRGIGVPPIAGRAIEPGDDVRDGANTVAVISDS